MRQSVTTTAGSEGADEPTVILEDGDADTHSDDEGSDDVDENEDAEDDVEGERGDMEDEM